MRKKEFIDRAVRAAERDLEIPAGWWGVWRDVTNGRVRVSFSASRHYWRITRDGVEVSRHDSRAFAIGKAKKL